MEKKSLIVELAEVVARHWPGREHVLRRAVRALVPHPGTLITTLLLVSIVLFAQNAGALPLRAPVLSGDSTTTISYQGRLADADGNPLTGTYNMIFRLYDAPTGGVPLWEEQWTGSNGVQVSDGLFNVMLGSLTQIPMGVVTGHDTLWLGITVGTDDEMTPRVQLGSVPFAVQALTVPDGAITAEKIADGAVTSAKLDPETNVILRYAAVTTDASGRATMGAYKAVLKPAHWWYSSGGGGYWATDYDFNYDSNVGRLSGLPANVQVIVYYINQPSGPGNPASSPPE